VSGFIGFLVVLALAIACFLLFRSMAKHLRKVPKSFDDDEKKQG
jgi:O-antigen ligase